jgi:hypothetical protein
MRTIQFFKSVANKKTLYFLIIIADLLVTVKQ